METIWNSLEYINAKILWGPPMVIFLLGTGLYLTVITRGMLFRRFGAVLRNTLGTLFSASPAAGEAGAVTPFQAVCTALAGTVGTGNIVGVALAIATGGPGAIFWLWISALIGMVVKYSEVALAVAWRRRNSDGQWVGGPMYYIADGLKMPILAIFFALIGALAACGMGAGVQGNSLAVSLDSAFGLDVRLTGLIVTVLAGLVLLGGIRRITGVTQVLVPFMAGFYILSSFVVLIVNFRQIPDAFGLIFRSAFTGTAATGGFLGASAMYACRVGMARGVFTHEAGIGSAPIAHACAATDHPARQGLWGAFEVFADSIVLCTVTALVVLTSGLWTQASASDGSLCARAFGLAIPGGQYIVTAGLCLFSFATIIAWYYYGEKCAEYLFRGNRPALSCYRIAYVACVFYGCLSRLDQIWLLADLFNGLMAIPNLIALLLLSPAVGRLTRDFFTGQKKLPLH